MLTLALLLAEDAPPPTTGGGPGGWFVLLQFGLIGIALYVMLIMPSRRQEKQRKELIASLKKNDRIVNSGGIIGIVESIKEADDEVVLRGGLRVTKSSIVKVTRPEDSSKD